MYENNVTKPTKNCYKAVGRRERGEARMYEDRMYLMKVHYVYIVKITMKPCCIIN